MHPSLSICSPKEIAPDETSPALAQRLARAGAQLMIATLQGLANGEIMARQQSEDLASYAPQLTKADSVVDWRRPALEIYNRFRAYDPWPGQASELHGKPVKILASRPLEIEVDQEPGTFVGLRDGRLAVACGGRTVLALERVQLPGKKPVSASEFVNGERLQVGERFGQLPVFPS